MDPKIITLSIIGIYLLLLLGVGFISKLSFRGTSSDYFVASRSIGPFMLLMSVFGTTMTAFALVGSTGKAYASGIGTYGLMASSSGLIHSACFFLVGIKLWAVGKRYGYETQGQYFRDRFESPALGYLLFPILVLLIIPYLLVGLLGGTAVIRGVTIKMFPEMFASTTGAIPPWLSALILCAVVLTYVFLGGVRSTAWANTFQTIVFMVMGVIAFVVLSKALGGLAEASKAVLENAPERAHRGGTVGEMNFKPIGKWQFASYMFIPLSVGMFPHLFQHWLTARSAKAFRLTVIAHPIFIMIVWVPCVLIGIWAAGKGLTPPPDANENAILSVAVKKLVDNPYLTGFLTAGILAAIMSSLDSQFMCIGTMFTNDIVGRLVSKEKLTDAKRLWVGRSFVVAIVAVTYALMLVILENPKIPGKIFPLGVWCFSGFAGLFPITVAAVYWKRATKAGAIAAVLAATGMWAYTFSLSGYGGEYLLFEGVLGEHDGIMPVAVITVTCAATLVIVSLLTPPPKAETIDKFFPKDLKG